MSIISFMSRSYVNKAQNVRYYLKNSGLTMSVLYSKNGCALISHKCYIDQIYHEVVDARKHAENDRRNAFVIKAGLFDITCDVKNKQNDSEEPKRHRKISAKKYKIEIETNAEIHDLNQQISSKSKEFLDECKKNNLFKEFAISRTNANDSFLLFKEEVADNILNAPLNGSNSSLDNAILTNISGQTYIIPPNCKFTNCYVSEIDNFAKELYDFVVIDPPWWNKYIRRVRDCKPEEGYDMMYNEDILKIPVEDLIQSNSIVAIWCTNSPTHLEFIKKVALPKWNLKLVTAFYWVKITNLGDPICEFSLPLRKQPYEHLFIATHIESDNSILSEMHENVKLICSIPSVVHSHKPPLLEIFKKYLPPHPKCLEIFARYLLPNFSSIGREVLKLQNVKLFDEVRQHT